MGSNVNVWIDKLIEICTTAGSKIVLALLIFIVGRIIIGKILKMFEKMKVMEKLEPTVRSFFMNFAKIVLYIVLVISIISVLGVPMASVITVLATCGVAIGMALQGALANVAGGLMLLIFRPFSVGDRVITGDMEGDCQEITLFYTTFLTPDNKKVTVPNGTLMAGNITNATAEPLRRVDLTFNVSGADLLAAREAILAPMAANEKVLKDPAPVAEPIEGIPGGMSFTARAWVKTEDYWDVYFGLMKEIPASLGQAGVGGPLPAYHIVESK